MKTLRYYEITDDGKVSPSLLATMRRFWGDLWHDLANLEHRGDIVHVADAATVVMETSFVRDVFAVTLGGNRVIDLQRHFEGNQFVVILRQDNNGNRTVTWDADVVWPGGTPPTLTATGNRTDVFAFVDTGAKYLGSTVGLNYTE